MTKAIQLRFSKRHTIRLSIPGFGLFHTECIPLEDRFVIIYESGVLRLSHDARVVWKQSLTYHDMYVGRDDHCLRFATDLETGVIKEWAINLQLRTLLEK